MRPISSRVANNIDFPSKSRKHCHQWQRQGCPKLGQLQNGSNHGQMPLVGSTVKTLRRQFSRLWAKAAALSAPYRRFNVSLIEFTINSHYVLIWTAGSVTGYTMNWGIPPQNYRKGLIRSSNTPISNRETAAPWQYNIFNRGADRVWIPPFRALNGRKRFYDYIWRIYGIAHICNSCCCHFGLCWT